MITYLQPSFVVLRKEITLFNIYKITNKINGKSYIGQTKYSVKRRFNQHSKSYLPIGAAIRKYGVENFEVSVLNIVETKDEANTFEIFYIKEYDTISPRGYNLAEGGGGSTGYKLSEEARQKISEAHKGKTLSDDTKQKISKAQSGEAGYWYGVTGADHPTYGERSYWFGKTGKNHPCHINAQPVYMLDKQTGELLRTFESGVEAVEWLKSVGFDKASNTGITHCCKGRKHTYLGYKWCRTGNIPQR
jgi:group I intron endonuclease